MLGIQPPMAADTDKSSTLPPAGVALHHTAGETAGTGAPGEDSLRGVIQKLETHLER